jgi:2-amino-4-hydroxy-6-hydroxymethyldihydropteridine diphosphokinase
MVDVYVSAGSNIEPEHNLVRALDALESTYGTLRVSPAYRNKPFGFEGADFINLVVGFTTDEPVERVRAGLQKIEALCDRPPNAPKWAARTMDLDILLYGDAISSEPGLLLPRPDLLRRAYMLKPLTDIAPEVVHPIEKKTMRELWDAFDQGAHELTVTTLTLA